jgi:hypothetical protein
MKCANISITCYFLDDLFALGSRVQGMGKPDLQDDFAADGSTENVAQDWR